MQRDVSIYFGSVSLIFTRTIQRVDCIKCVNSVSKFLLKYNYDTILLDGYEYSWSTKKERVRPGLNVFDDKGQELDWVICFQRRLRWDFIRIQIGTGFRFSEIYALLKFINAQNPNDNKVEIIHDNQ